MKTYLVSWTEIQKVACSVEVQAESEEKALEMVESGEYDGMASGILQDTLETRDYRAEVDE